MKPVGKNPQLNWNWNFNDTVLEVPGLLKKNDIFFEIVQNVKYIWMYDLNKNFSVKQNNLLA